MNWVEGGLGFFTRVVRVPTTRSDIDESFLPAEHIPLPDVSYFDNSDWGYSMTTKTDVRLRMERILK